MKHLVLIALLIFMSGCANRPAVKGAPNNYVTYVKPAPVVSQCEKYQGVTVSPTKFSTLYKELSISAKPKGEYETTLAFNTRLKTLDTDQTYLIQGEISGYHFEYNADNSSLVIDKRAFGLDMNRRSYYHMTPSVSFTKILNNNVDIILGRDRVDNGEYMGVTGFGVPMIVTRTDDNHRIIFDKAGTNNKAGLFKGNITISNVAPEWVVSFKKEAKVFLVSKPKYPYASSGSRNFYAKIDDPYDTTENIKMIVADISCALITGADNIVVQAVETR